MSQTTTVHTQLCWGNLILTVTLTLSSCWKFHFLMSLPPSLPTYLPTYFPTFLLILTEHGCRAAWGCDRRCSYLYWCGYHHITWTTWRRCFIYWRFQIEDIFPSEDTFHDDRDLSYWLDTLTFHLLTWLLDNFPLSLTCLCFGLLRGKALVCYFFIRYLVAWKTISYVLGFRLLRFSRTFLCSVFWLIVTIRNRGLFLGKASWLINILSLSWLI